MPYKPISNTVPQYAASGSGLANAYYLKGYQAGTTTALAMGIDETPTSTLAKCKLNSLGYPISNSSDETTVFIPHFNEAYKLVLYSSETDADNNTFANAVWVVDNLSVDDTTSSYASTVAVMKTLALSVGEMCVTGGYTTLGDGGGATYKIVAGGTGTDDGGEYHDLNNGNQAQLIHDNCVNVMWWGATGDGSTDDTTFISNAMAAVGAAGKLIFPSGTYKVDVTSSSLTLTPVLEFLPGGMLVIYRTSGSNYVDIRNTVEHYNTQIIDVTNVYATKATWDAAWDINGGTFPIYFGYGTSTYNEVYHTKSELNPFLFGATGQTDTPTDDAYPVQICFDMHRPTKFTSSHYVSKVTIRGNERNIDTGRFKIIELSGSTDYNAMVEIKCGQSQLKIRADTNKSQYYQTCFHWYTESLTTHTLVGQNELTLWAENSYIGLVVGGLPGQSTFLGQTEEDTAPNAIDAPLSESNLRLHCSECLCNILMNQPNGKIQGIECQLATSTTSGFSAPASGRDTLALANYSTIWSLWTGSELDLVGGEIVHTETSDTVPPITVQGGRVNIVGTHIELSGHMRMKTVTGTYASNGSTNAGSTYYGQSKLALHQISNLGWNGAIDSPMVLIENDCSGHFIMTNCEPTFNNAGYANRTAPFAMVTDTFTGLDADATVSEIISASTLLDNPYMKVFIDNCVFRDQAWQSSSSNLIGMFRGLPNIHLGHISTLGAFTLDVVDPSDSPSIPSITKQLSTGPGVAGAFAGQFDPTGEQVGAARTSGTHAGWTVTTSGGSAQVDGVSIADGPIIPGDDITDSTPSRYTYALRLTTTTATHTCYVTSPACGVFNAKAVRLSFYVRSISGSPSTNNFIARLSGFKQDGTTATTDYDAVVCYESNIDSEWEHISTIVEVDKTTVNAKLFFYVENGCAVEITGIEIN